MTEVGKKRLYVLTYSLGLEKVASFVLGFIFDREDFQNTKSFGNQSTSLSFNQKMYLLLDYGAIEKDDKIVLDALMNIRNQFMHNADCESYIDAVRAIDGLENKFKKLYKHNFTDDNLEVNLEKCIDEAIAQAMEALSNIKGGIEKKITMETLRDSYKEYIIRSGNRLQSLFIELGNEIIDDKFDFQDKETLIRRLAKFRDGIFELKEVEKE